ncbi:MAG: gamma-glutamylcyclotransferase family protein [Nitrososphaera sp.]
MLHKIFVYGSLKKGFGNHGLLAISNSKFLGSAKTHPIFTMVDFGTFPGCLINGETAIHGEVYEITDEVLAWLDKLEGHPNFYRRVEISSTLGPVWMYVLSRTDFSITPIVKNGIWE